MRIVYLSRCDNKSTRSVFHKSKTFTLCGHRIVAPMCVSLCGTIAHYSVCMWETFVSTKVAESLRNLTSRSPLTIRTKGQQRWVIWVAIKLWNTSKKAVGSQPIFWVTLIYRMMQNSGQTLAIPRIQYSGWCLHWKSMCLQRYFLRSSDK
jgi:hypothetical protein